jgi:hypothetical protein
MLCWQELWLPQAGVVAQSQQAALQLQLLRLALHPLCRPLCHPLCRPLLLGIQSALLLQRLLPRREGGQQRPDEGRYGRQQQGIAAVANGLSENAADCAAAQKAAG